MGLRTCLAVHNLAQVLNRAIYEYQIQKNVYLNNKFTRWRSELKKDAQKKGHKTALFSHAARSKTCKKRLTGIDSQTTSKFNGAKRGRQTWCCRVNTNDVTINKFTRPISFASTLRESQED